MSRRASAAAATGPARQDSGDRAWTHAAAETVEELTRSVRSHARAIGTKVGVDAVHDMRTTTRRLRTAITVFGADADPEIRATVEKELKRVAHRLGAVRDEDVLLETLGATSTTAGLDPLALRPLRRAWKKERRSAARHLERELRRRRFDRSLRRARRLAPTTAGGSTPIRNDDGSLDRVASRAPGMIWDAFGALLAFDIDPATAEAAVIHRMRIAAKQLRYTLEAFEDALEPGRTLIDEVTALQDAAGEMHDAIVAGDRAQSTLAEGHHLRDDERGAIESFVEAQRAQADELRPGIARRLAAIRAGGFRDSLARAVATMGHVRPRDAV